MLRHENLELNLMKKYNMVHEDAHTLAEQKYNYKKELDEFLGKDRWLNAAFRTVVAKISDSEAVYSYFPEKKRYLWLNCKELYKITGRDY